MPEDPHDDPRSPADDGAVSNPIPPSVDPPTFDPQTFDPHPTVQLPSLTPASPPPPMPDPPSWSAGDTTQIPPPPGADQTPSETPAAELPWYTIPSPEAQSPWPSEPMPAWEPVATASTEQRPRRRVWPALVAVVVAAGLIGGGLAYGLSNGTSTSSDATAVPLVQSTVAAPQSNASQMIQRILPSVVNVRVTEQTTDQFGAPQTGQAEGSGVVLTKGGLIVTNAHVVSGATSVKVVFTNGHASLDATVLGVDTTHDLAVLKVNANDLVPITVGHSSSLKLGDQVWAIGFPLDLGTTVTEGIISGIDRTIDVQRPDGSSEHLIGMLQTDAAINPGNSGGALVDAAGQLVGINTAGASASVAQNVGFAIAIDGAASIVNDLAAGKSPSGGSTQAPRPWLGVVVADGANGVSINSVVAGSPAASAGLKAGDVIVAIDGTTIRTSADVTAALSSHKPGDTVRVTVTSQGSQRTVSVKLGTRPATLP